MQRRIVLGLMTMVVGIAPGLVAQAEDAYIVPAITYTYADSKRNVDDDIGLEFAAGLFLNDSFAIEGRLGATQFDGAPDVDTTEFGIFGRWVFLRDGRISPYLLGGVGVLESDSGLATDDTSAALSIGAGLDLRFGSSPWALRAEYRSRASSQSNVDLTDQIATLGLRYSFGKKSAPVAVAAAAVDPDTDGDGVPDSRDQCPSTPPGASVDARGCEVDSDRDGVVDSRDRCPNTPAGAAVDVNGCELDSDNDGVVDSKDECPNTAAGAPVDRRGCEIRGTIRLEGVQFETNSDRLLPEANRVLDQAAAALAKYPDLVVEVAGHTDAQGDAGYNLGLSERRAKTVRDYLIANGANAGSLTARGYGETEPVADNGTAEGRAQNRRVELRVIEQDKQ